jgi:hypothetical protein
MSAPTSAPSAPFQQWQSFYPASNGPYGYGYDQQPVSIQDQIYASVNGNAERTKQQAANDIARDILRAVDQGSALNSHATEITAAQLASAIERNGNANQSTTERVNSQLATAVERNGANNMAAIERTTGEGRLTTVISDAASRQASNDSARDILRAIDRIGTDGVSASKDTHTALLSSIERNAGEGRVQTLSAAGQTDAKLTDIRHSILNDVNRSASDVLLANTQNLNVLTKHVTDGAWEQRSAMSNGFQNISEEYLKTKFDLSSKASDHYSSLMLESQKLGHFMSAKADGHFAAGQLELQKVKEGITMQAANNFAINQLEMVKGFAASQLEAQKNREAIQKDLCEAKYEALKSQQYLGDKLSECCCKLEAKMDVIDRDRLRDNLIVSRDDNNVLKILELGALGYGRGGDRGDRGDRGHHGRR